MPRSVPTGVTGGDSESLMVRGAEIQRCGPFLFQQDFKAFKQYNFNKSTQTQRNSFHYSGYVSIFSAENRTHHRVYARSTRVSRLGTARLASQDTGSQRLREPPCSEKNFFEFVLTLGLLYAKRKTEPRFKCELESHYEQSWFKLAFAYRKN